MTKIIYVTIVLFFCLGILSCKAEEVTVTINNLRLDEKKLQFDFILENNTDNTIWFCKDIDDKSEIDYEIKVDEKKKRIMIRFVSFIVPQNILLEEPIWAKYSKLHPKKSFRRNIKVEVPISEISPIRKKESSEVKQIMYANTLILEIGIYKLNLEDYKTQCCRDDSNSQNAFVNCFWAEKNKEQTIRTQMENQKIPVVIQQWQSHSGLYLLKWQTRSKGRTE